LKAARRRVLPERLGEGGGERDRTLALLALRDTDAKRALDEVDFAPAQGLELEPADPRQHQRQEDQRCLLVGELAQDATDLDRLKDSPAPPSDLWPFRPVDRVRLDELLSLRRLEHVVQDV
jgi:hypothetical protein